MKIDISKIKMNELSGVSPKEILDLIHKRKLKKYHTFLVSINDFSIARTTSEFRKFIFLGYTETGFYGLPVNQKTEPETILNREIIVYFEDISSVKQCKMTEEEIVESSRKELLSKILVRKDFCGEHGAKEFSELIYADLKDLFELDKNELTERLKGNSNGNL